MQAHPPDSPPPAILPVVFHFISPDYSALMEQPVIPEIFLRIIEAQGQRPRPDKMSDRHLFTILTGVERLVRQHITTSAQAGIQQILNQLIKAMKNAEKQIDKTAKDPQNPGEESSGKEPGVNTGRVLLKLKVFDTEKLQGPEQQNPTEKGAKELVLVQAKPQGEMKGEEKLPLPIAVNFKRVDPEKAIPTPSANIKKGMEENRPEGTKPPVKENLLVAAKTSELNQKHMPVAERGLGILLDKPLPKQEAFPPGKPRIEEKLITGVAQKDTGQRPEEKPREEAKAADKPPQAESVDKPRDIPRDGRYVEHVRVEQHARTEHQAQNKTIPRVENDPVMPAWMGIQMPGFAKEAIEDFEKRSAQYGLGGNADHKLIDLLFMVLSAVICGAQSLPEIVKFIESRENWFKAVLGLRHGIPSRRLIWTFIAGLDPQQFQRVVVKWLHFIRGGSHSKPGVHAAAHLPSVHIWDTPIGLIIGQLDKNGDAVDGEAVPDLLDAFYMRNSLIMAYGVDPRVNSARRIVERAGEYLIEIDAELDANIVQAREMVANPKAERLKSYESYIEGQERLVAVVLKDADRQIEQHWGSKAKALLKLVYQPILFSGPSITERMFVSSLEHPSEDLFSMARVQRKAEARCEWVVQFSFAPVTYADLQERIRQNLALFEAYGIKLIEQINGVEADVAASRKKASSDPEFLLKLFG